MNGTEAREWVDYEIPMPWGKVSGKYYITHDLNQYQIVQQNIKIDLDFCCIISHEEIFLCLTTQIAKCSADRDVRAIEAHVEGIERKKS